MAEQSLYIVTGGAGFIGSAFLAKLNSVGVHSILVVDELDESSKWKNLLGKSFLDYSHKTDFLRDLDRNLYENRIRAIIHMGACSATTEQNAEYLMQNNFKYSVKLASYAIQKNIRFLYASSAATYGDGELGYSDADAITPTLRPLNPYGFSKQLFDLWALREQRLRRMVGLKFFNVFGPNEYHKGGMRSMVHKAFQQIQASGSVKLFKSHRPEYGDGEQKRDFVYVKDCVDVMWWMLQHSTINGLFNLGSGKARTWNELAHAVFAALGLSPTIEYIDMPSELQGQYQYFTEADMKKLSTALPQFAPSSLEAAVSDYVQNYLLKGEARM
jgi:ADP-L-glycero-D-manno-heptose 6-epimerase